MSFNLDRIKEFPIAEYARMIGFTVTKIGRFETLKNHPSVRICPDENDPRKDFFIRNSTGAKGSVIDFAVEFQNITVAEAIKRIGEIMNSENISPKEYKKPIETFNKKEKRDFILPEKSENMNRAFAYLNKTRQINQSIIKKFAHEKRLYQDVRGNCVFVSYDENGIANFGSVRGTNTNSRFVADISGSDYSYCFRVDGKSTAETLVATESVIDLMSVMSVMSEHGRSLSNYNFLSLNGVSKQQALTNYIKSKPDINNVVLAYDNDAAGRKGINTSKQILEDIEYTGKITEFLPKDAKDWNEQIKLAKEQAKQLSVEENMCKQLIVGG